MRLSEMQELRIIMGRRPTRDGIGDSNYWRWMHQLSNLLNHLREGSLSDSEDERAQVCAELRSMTEGLPASDEVVRLALLGLASLNEG